MYYHILLLIISYIKGEINQISISYDDIDNINGENVLKKCYESCKQCEIGGNSINIIVLNVLKIIIYLVKILLL